MRYFCIIAILFTCATAQTTPPAAQAQTPAATPAPVTYDEAVANEKKLFAADQKHDLDTIKSIVADDFVDIGADGKSIGKEALLKEIPTLKLLRYEQNNFHVVALGPYAYSISYYSDATMIGADGKETRSQHGLNSVWIRRDGRWQMLMHCRGTANYLGQQQ
jgi:hypothetical protein